MKERSLYASITSEIKRLESLLSKLKEVKAELETPTEAPATSPKSSPKPSSKRAPHGEFQGTILKLFGPDDTLSNAEVRDRLAKAEWPKSGGKGFNMHVRKTLMKMVKAGKLTQIKDGDSVRYSLPKAA